MSFLNLKLSSLNIKTPKGINKYILLYCHIFKTFQSESKNTKYILHMRKMAKIELTYRAIIERTMKNISMYAVVKRIRE